MKNNYKDFYPIDNIISNLTENDTVWDFLYSILMHTAALVFDSIHKFQKDVKGVIPDLNKVECKSFKDLQTITLQYDTGREKEIQSRYRFAAFKLVTFTDLKQAWIEFCDTLKHALKNFGGINFEWIKTWTPVEILDLQSAAALESSAAALL